jgi:hypothetical protein
MPDLSRRSLITGLISLVAAPAIVRVSSLMPVKAYVPETFDWSPYYTVYPTGSLQCDPIVFKDIMYWVTKAEPQIVQWSSVAEWK